jgi:protoporphyrinogen oxidase
VTVLEADEIVGGISRTAQYRGFRFDIGGHRFFTKIRPVEELWEEILGDEFIRVPRLSRIHYSGRYFDYPLKALNALRGLGLVNAIRIVLSYLHARLRPSPVEETFEQCTEIRAEWAAQRIQGLSLEKAILNAASLNRRSTAIKSLIHEFRYPRLGPGQMWEMCRDRIEAMGNQVLLQHRVSRLDRAGDRVVSVHATTPGGDQSFQADHVISTTDLRALVRAMTPAAPPPVADAASGLRYRDFLVVALILEQPDLFPDNWIYVHTPGVKVGRIQNFNNWSRAMVPEPGRTCLGFEYFCFEGDGLWQTADADLVALAGRELEQLGLAPASLVRDGTVIRMPKAYPIYDGAYRQHLETIRSWLDPIENLHTVGRNGMHKYNNQDHSMLTAMMAVWNMQGEGHDVWAVNTDFEYHEEQHVRTERGALRAAEVEAA